MEHNLEHADEFRRWAGQAGGAAAEALLLANRSLEAALEKLGGGVSHEGHHAD
jgi:hypothetical protein